jgi:hypothetical protein
MPALVLTLLVLVLRLAAKDTRPDENRTPASRRAWILATAAVVASLVPALLDAKLLAGSRSRLSADAASHLAIAQDIARHGLPHGWIPTSNGGFPVAIHYPPVGWLTTAGLLRLGVHPVVAIKGLGFVAMLAVPLLVLLAARLVQARPTSAAAGAIAIAWVTPYIQFTGGWDVFFLIGLLSQTLVIPAAIAWAASLTQRWRFDPAPLLAGLCAATHPQVFAVASIAIAASAVATWDRTTVGRTLRSVLGGGFVAIPLYGPGLSSMVAPFGWPPNLSWRHIGFGPERVFGWLVDGDRRLECIAPRPPVSAEAATCPRAGCRVDGSARARLVWASARCVRLCGSCIALGLPTDAGTRADSHHCCGVNSGRAG